MKRIFVLLIGVMTICAGFAQVVEEGEPALVYYSPKTSVSLDFTYTVEIDEPGMYAQYAESMIGAHDAVKQARTAYTLTDVRIGTATGTDYSRPHKVVAEHGFPLLLSLNEKNLLVGYNLPATEKNDKPNAHAHKPGKKEKHSNACAVPYPEDVLSSASSLAQANVVAKQIFHLRETRMYLINGEVEHAPADGEAMKLVLAELDKQEEQLTALFVGRKTTRTEHKLVRFNPAEKSPQLFFSEENGFTDAENIDADTIRVEVNKLVQKYAPVPVTDKKEKKKPAAELSQLVYNLPGSADISVEHKGRTLGNRTVQVAQFGIDVPLAKDLFTGATLPVIVFSEKTGNVVSISK